MTADRNPKISHLTLVSGNSEHEVVKAAMADELIPQDTLLPLLDAPLDELAAYLAGHTWEARKDYLNNMMHDSLDSLFKQTEVFETKGLPKSELMAISEECLVGLHVKIGQLLDAWGVTRPADKHAAVLFVLSASSEHRHALARWMPNGTTSPPEEHRLCRDQKVGCSEQIHCARCASSRTSAAAIPKPSKC